MHLLLTHGYFLAEDAKELQIMKPYPPLGLLYLSSHLRQRGFGVEIYDSTFGSREELYRVLETGQSSVLGVYSTLMTRGSVIQIIEAAKQRGWRVVAGGPEPASYAAEYLSAGADIVVEAKASGPWKSCWPWRFRRTRVSTPARSQKCAEFTISAPMARRATAGPAK